MFQWITNDSSMTTIICTGRRIYSYRAGSIEMAAKEETVRRSLSQAM